MTAAHFEGHPTDPEEPVEYTGNGTAGREADVKPTGFFFQMPKPEQEPVAWMYQCSADSSGPVLMQHKRDWAESGSGLWTETPLYTTPPQRKPLTDEQIKDITADIHGLPIHVDDYTFARAIEAAHGIKENT